MDKKIVQALSQVVDPELGLDIIRLGFVRQVEVDWSASQAQLVMTLTSPLCPMRSQIVSQVESALKGLGLKKIQIELSFEPPWTPPAEAKAILGI